jgi:hypothetical protein
VGPKGKQTIRGKVLKKKRGLSPDDDGNTTRDTLRASQGRIKKKRDGALRNWQEAKARNCTPNKIYEDILEATAENMAQVFENLRKLGYAVIRDFNQLRDPNQPNTYSLFQEKNTPTLAQAQFYKNSEPR